MKPLSLTDPDLNWRTRQDAKRASAAMRIARRARNEEAAALIFSAGLALVGLVALLSLLSSY